MRCPKCSHGMIAGDHVYLTPVNKCPLCGLMHIPGGFKASLERQLVGLDEFEKTRMFLVYDTNSDGKEYYYEHTAA